MGLGGGYGAEGVVMGPGGPCPTAPAPQVPREALEPSLPVVLSSGETPCGALWGNMGWLWGDVGQLWGDMGWLWGNMG